jgi:hypothetical protein
MVFYGYKIFFVHKIFTLFSLSFLMIPFAAIEDMKLLSTKTGHGFKPSETLAAQKDRFNVGRLKRPGRTVEIDDVY